MKDRLLTSPLGKLASIVAFLLASQGLSQDLGEDPLLALGIRQSAEGNFEEAVFTLDTAVRRLEERPGRLAELTEAYVQLGVAYLGLDHEQAAKGKLRQALKLDPALRLSPERFAPRVLKLFDELALEQEVIQKKRIGRRFLIIGGLAAGAGVGVAAAVRGEELPSNRDPSAVGFIVTPAGSVVGITAVTFVGVAADADGDAVSFSWDLGDGTRTSGPSVTHVYTSPGDYQVTLTATDGRGGTASSSSAYPVRSLTGTWYSDEGSVQDPYLCVQSGSALECRPETLRYPGVRVVQGTISNPLELDLTVASNSSVGTPNTSGSCVGRVLPSLECFVCGAGHRAVFLALPNTQCR